jgi:hypothetical protein
MCTVLLPSVVNTTAVKHISYHIISYIIISYISYHHIISFHIIYHHIYIILSYHFISYHIYLTDILSFPVRTTRYLELLLPQSSCASAVKCQERTNKSTAAIFFQIPFHYLSSSFIKLSLNFTLYKLQICAMKQNFNYVFSLIGIYSVIHH